MKQANIFIGKNLAGVLTEDDLGYEFKDPFTVITERTRGRQQAGISGTSRRCGRGRRGILSAS